MLPTVAEVLRLEVLHRGRPRVVAGADATANLVRWVHVSELADIAKLLSGGELVLTTGVNLPDDARALDDYVADLVAAGTSGLVVELGRRFRDHLPAAMVHGAERHHLPLVALERETAFVSVTEAVHSLIIDSQLFELRRAQQLHATFTELSLEGATVKEILVHVGRLGSAPAVFEDLAHQVVELDPAGRSPEEFLDDWEARSRLAVCEERVAYHPATGLLASRVGARGEDWGRLVIVCDDVPTNWLRMLIEQATTALAFSRLIERDRAGTQRQAARALLTAILDRHSSEAETVSRAKALGVPLLRRQLVGVTAMLLDPPPPGTVDAGSATRALADSLGRAMRQASLPALVGVLEENQVSALVSLPTGANVDRELSTSMSALPEARTGKVVVGAGSTAQGIGDARRSVVESGHVAQVARTLPTRTYYRLADLGARGLVHLLRDDPRLQSFVERQLGALLNAKPAEREVLLATLSAYLRFRGNKKSAAAGAHISRSVFYQRLAKVEAVLGVNLDDPEVVTSLHLATLALDQLRSPRS